MQHRKLIKNLSVILPLLALSACSSTTTTEQSEGTETTKPAEVTQTIDAVTNNSQTAEEQKRNAALRESQTVFFDFDDSTIDSQFNEVIGAHAAFLRANPDIDVIIEGHADERGTPEYNIALGERRANAVASFLEAYGVPTSQISIVSYGEEKPLSLGHTAEAYKKNRRAVLVY